MIPVLHEVSGTVTRGDGYGKKLGFPTANLDNGAYSRSRSAIPLGIYAGIAEIVDDNSSFAKGGGESASRRIFKAGIVVGPKDTTGKVKIEAHLLDFSGVLYGKLMHLSLKRFLRPYRTFENEDALKKQIAEDVRGVRKAISLVKGQRG